MASCSTPIRVTNPISNTGTRTISSNGQSVQQLEKIIEQESELMPWTVMEMLVESARPVDLHVLVGFWSEPMWSSVLTWGIIPRIKNKASSSDTSFRLALTYLKLGKMKEARALTLNGSFMLQCSEIPIANIAKLCKEKGTDASVDDFNLPIFSQAFHSLRTPQTMEAFCLGQLPHKCHDRMGIGTARTSVTQTGERWTGWTGDSSTINRPTPSPKTASTETQIQLILVCDANADERHSLSIGSSKTLKTLFSDYAKERGDSLRSLRFSYRGNTLFLSSAGNKTPDQLNMCDRDVITVHGTSTAQEKGSDGDASKQKNKAATKKAKATKNQSKKPKGKGKKKNKSQQVHPVETLQEWKAQHSKKLSKVHDEVYHRLKEIRTRLNALDLKCQLPKQKRRKMRKTKAKHNVDNTQILPHSGIGKAGKSFFSIQVGEVQHLYKPTNKPSQKMSRSDATAFLDLHGCTRWEAIQQLDESLPVWVDIAMRGSYPFVTPATIVCGGGNQILSQVVEEWIREHAQVANAIKKISQ